METNRKEIQESTTYSELETHLGNRIYRSLLESESEAVALLDDTRTLIYANPGMASLMGIPEGELPGRTLDPFIHPEDVGEVRRVLENRTTMVPGRFRLRRGDGGWQWVNCTARDLHDSGYPGLVLTLHASVDPAQGENRQWEDEAKIRLIMDSARDYAMMLLDPEGRINIWSQGAEKILGYEEKEVLGLSTEIFFLPEEIEAGAPAEEMREATEKGRAEDERWHVRKDGTRFFASGVLTAIWDKDGRRIGFCKVMRDITDKMLSQEALSQSRQYFEALVDSIDGIVWEADGVSMKHTFVNKKAESILGHTHDKWLKEYWTALVYEEDRERVRNQWEQAFRDKKGYTLDVRLIDSQGRKRWFRDYVNAVEQPSGAVKLRAVLVEVTPQKAAERRQEMQLRVTSILAASSTLAKAAQEILPIMGRALEWDAAVFWCLDRKQNRLKPLKSWSVDPVKHDAFLQDLRFRTLAPGESPAGAAFASNQPIWIEVFARDALEWDAQRARLASDDGLFTVFATPVPAADGPLGALEFFSSITRPEEPDIVGTASAIASQIGLFAERLRAEEALWDSQEQLRQSQKMEAIGRLAGGIAHDFNNLLTAINGYSDLLMARLEQDSPYRPHIEEIHKAGRRAAALTYQLLAYSRKQVMALKIVNLNTIITEMGSMLQRLLGEDIRLEMRLSPDLKLVKMDPGQLEQVIMNLAVNSRDAMPDGGVLSLETGNVSVSDLSADIHYNLPPGEYVSLAVRDTGKGIDENVKARLFEPFFTTKEAGKGTGLGLSMVYGIVKQSGGAIYVNSEPEKGATFSLYLPVAVESPQLPPGPEDIGQDRREARDTILLVEDEEGVRNLAREILVHEGYEVLAAEGGEEALILESAHSGPIHLLLTDFIMKGMNGREVFEALSARRPGMRVLYMSGYTEDAIVRHGVETSGSAFLQKPFSPRALVHKVERLLREADAKPA